MSYLFKRNPFRYQTASNWILYIRYSTCVVHEISNRSSILGVRGTKGFTEGEHYWEVVFLEPPCGTSVMVGVGTENVVLHRSNFEYVDLIG